MPQMLEPKETIPLRNIGKVNATFLSSDRLLATSGPPESPLQESTPAQ